MVDTVPSLVISLRYGGFSHNFFYFLQWFFPPPSNSCSIGFQVMHFVFPVDDSGDGDDGQDIEDGTSAKHTEELHVRAFIPTHLL